jgi:chitin synthase
MTLILRICVLIVFFIHGVPLLLHAFMYCKSKLVVEVLGGLLSFIFYNPTYLVLLNIYAICRIDDISWGTKGRDDQESGKSAALKQKWKKIKNLYVFKYMFWNIAASFVFLMTAHHYFVRLVVTFAIMVMVLAILGIKTILGILYLLKYRCCQTSKVAKCVPRIGIRYINPSVIGNEAES